MPVPSSLTLNYDAVLSTTLFNYAPTMEDEISTSNAFLFFLMKKRPDAYKKISDIGDRMAIPLMYALTPADSYSGYDTLDVNPTDGITTAFYTWRQMSAPITISGLDEKKNAGSEVKLLDLLESKTKQAILGIQDLFGKALFRGNGVNGGAITTAYTSPNNASLFVDPVPAAINYTLASSLGNLAGATYTWWQNQKKASSASTYAAWLKELRNLNNNCAKGPGGAPDLHIAEQQTYELYEAALAASHRNPDYQKADIPFENIAFKGKPVVWDEFIPDAANGTVAITKGSWYMLNTMFWYLKVHKETNFTAGPFIRPENQDAKTAHVYWLGAAGVSNRRKHGVMGNVDLTIAS